MASPRWIALIVLVMAGGVVAGCGGRGSGGPGETSVTPPAVPISIARTGGIAGVNQAIDIAADGTWVYTDKRSNQRETGTLASAERIHLHGIVADPNFTAQLAKGTKIEAGCADGFHYTINTGGETYAYEDCGGTGAPVVKDAIAVVTEATPF